MSQAQNYSQLLTSGTFVERCQAMRNFKAAVVDRTCCANWTVLRWMNGAERPNVAKRRAIAEMLGATEEELFPPVAGDDAETNESSTL